MKKFIIILLTLYASSSQSQIDIQGRWFSRAPLPTPRQEIAHAVLNGKIYVPGGLVSGGTGTTIVEVFNPSTNTWSIAAPLPEPLHHLGLAVVNGRLYVLGGYRGDSFVPNHKVYALFPDSNVWREKTSMLIARGAHIAVTYQNKIYVIGGVVTGFTVSGRTDVYDPFLDSWNIVANMPTPREHLSGGLIDSLIYVAGGRSGSGNYNTLEAYSPSSNNWYSKPSMPTARGGLTAASMNGRLYVFGGEAPGVFPQNEEYNPVTNSWRTMTPMKTPRHGIGAATVGDSIFIIGGGVVQGYSVTAANDAFTLAPLVLNLNFLIEGFFNPAGNSTVTDTVRVFLRKAVSPYALIDSAKGVFSSSGFVSLKFNRAQSDSGYYIVVRHRNSIETWSSSANAFMPSIINYDFTTSASKAFGSNEILKGSKYCIYSGDVNQDGLVDGSDLSAADNAAFMFATGYINTDVTGDNITDASDLSIIDNNAFNNVSMITP